MSDMSGNLNSWLKSREMIDAWDGYDKKQLNHFIVPEKAGKMFWYYLHKNILFKESD